MPGDWEYEHSGEREQDDRKTQRARDLARAGIYDEAIEEAGRLYHLQRSNRLIDEIARKRDRGDT